ncbi:hypothetical protein LCGC14_0692740, partial [marine sediment metagenome]
MPQHISNYFMSPPKYESAADRYYRLQREQREKLEKASEAGYYSGNKDDEYLKQFVVREEDKPRPAGTTMLPVNGENILAKINAQLPLESPFKVDERGKALLPIPDPNLLGGYSRNDLEKAYTEVTQKQIPPKVAYKASDFKYGSPFEGTRRQQLDKFKSGLRSGAIIRNRTNDGDYIFRRYKDKAGRMQTETLPIAFIDNDGQLKPITVQADMVYGGLPVPMAIAAQFLGPSLKYTPETFKLAARKHTRESLESEGWWDAFGKGAFQNPLTGFNRTIRQIGGDGKIISSDRPFSDPSGVYKSGRMWGDIVNKTAIAAAVTIGTAGIGGALGATGMGLARTAGALGGSAPYLSENLQRILTGEYTPAGGIGRTLLEAGTGAAGMSSALKLSKKVASNILDPATNIIKPLAGYIVQTGVRQAGIGAVEALGRIGFDAAEGKPLPSMMQIAEMVGTQMLMAGVMNAVFEIATPPGSVKGVFDALSIRKQGLSGEKVFNYLSKYADVYTPEQLIKVLKDEGLIKTDIAANKAIQSIEMIKEANARLRSAQEFAAMGRAPVDDPVSKVIYDAQQADIKNAVLQMATDPQGKQVFYTKNVDHIKSETTGRTPEPDEVSVQKELTVEGQPGYKSQTVQDIGMKLEKLQSEKTSSDAIKTAIKKYEVLAPKELDPYLGKKINTWNKPETTESLMDVYKAATDTDGTGTNISEIVDVLVRIGQGDYVPSRFLEDGPIYQNRVAGVDGYKFKAGSREEAIADILAYNERGAIFEQFVETLKTKGLDDTKARQTVANIFKIQTDTFGEIKTKFITKNKLKTYEDFLKQFKEGVDEQGKSAKTGGERVEGEAKEKTTEIQEPVETVARPEEQVQQLNEAQVQQLESAINELAALAGQTKTQRIEATMKPVVHPQQRYDAAVSRDVAEQVPPHDYVDALAQAEITNQPLRTHPDDIIARESDRVVEQAVIKEEVPEVETYRSLIKPKDDKFTKKYLAGLDLLKEIENLNIEGLNIEGKAGQIKITSADDFYSVREILKDAGVDQNLINDVGAGKDLIINGTNKQIAAINRKIAAGKLGKDVVKIRETLKDVGRSAIAVTGGLLSYELLPDNDEWKPYKEAILFGSIGGVGIKGMKWMALKPGLRMLVPPHIKSALDVPDIIAQGKAMELTSIFESPALARYTDKLPEGSNIARAGEEFVKKTLVLSKKQDDVFGTGLIRKLTSFDPLTLGFRDVDKINAYPLMQEMLKGNTRGNMVEYSINQTLKEFTKNLPDVKLAGLIADANWSVYQDVVTIKNNYGLTPNEKSLAIRNAVADENVVNAIQRSSQRLTDTRDLSGSDAAALLPNYKQWREYMNQTSSLEIEGMLSDKYQITPETMAATKAELIGFKEEYEANMNELKEIKKEIKARGAIHPESKRLSDEIKLINEEIKAKGKEHPDYKRLLSERKAISQEKRLRKEEFKKYKELVIASAELKKLTSEQTRLITNKANQDGLYQSVSGKLKAIENAEAFLAQSAAQQHFNAYTGFKKNKPYYFSVYEIADKIKEDGSAMENSRVNAHDSRADYIMMFKSKKNLDAARDKFVSEHNIERSGDGNWIIDAVNKQGQKVDVDDNPISLSGKAVKRVKVRMNDKINVNSPGLTLRQSSDQIKTTIQRVLQMQGGRAKFVTKIKEGMAEIKAEQVKLREKFDPDGDPSQSNDNHVMTEVNPQFKELDDLTVQALEIMSRAEQGNMGINDIKRNIEKLLSYTLLSRPPQFSTPRGSRGMTPNTANDWLKTIMAFNDSEIAMGTNAISRGHTLKEIDRQLADNADMGIKNEWNEHLINLRRDITNHVALDKTTQKFAHAANLTALAFSVKVLSGNALSGVKNVSQAVQSVAMLVNLAGWSSVRGVPAAAKTGVHIALKTAGMLNDKTIARIKPFADISARINKGIDNVDLFKNDKVLSAVHKKLLKRRMAADAPTSQLEGDWDKARADKFFFVQRGGEYINRMESAMMYAGAMKKELDGLSFNDRVEKLTNDAAAFASLTQGRYSIQWRSPLERKVATSWLGRNLMTMWSPAFRAVYLWGDMLGRAGGAADTPRIRGLAALATMGVVGLMLGGEKRIPGLKDILD